MGSSSLPSYTASTVLLPGSTAQFVTLSTELWQLLISHLDLDSNGKEEDLEEISIALELTKNGDKHWVGKARKTNSSSQQNGLKKSASSSASAASKPKLSVSIPAHLLSSSSSSPLPTSLQISLSTPLPLTQIILISTTPASFTYASNPSNHSSLASRSSIIREGESLSVVGGGEWTIAMCEPVLQGTVDASTKWWVLPPTPTAEVISAEEEPAQKQQEEEEAEEDSEEGIDEDFLSSSFLPQLPPSLPSTPSRSLPTNNSLSLSSSPSQQTLSSLASSTKLISALPLQQQIPSSLLSPTPKESEDDIARAFVYTKDLRKLGVLSGDWVVLKSVGGTPSSTAEAEDAEATSGERDESGRLVRVFGGLEKFSSWATASSSSSLETASIYLAPTLLRNLSTSTLSLTPTHLTTPSLPTAQSLTIARLASPHSVNKIFQNVFLKALKEYFSGEGGKLRVVKEGDLIAVGISEEGIRFDGIGSSNGSNGNGNASTPEEGKEEVGDFELPTPSPAAATPIFFLLSSLTPPTLPPRPPGHTVASELIDSIDTGKLGCLVDPAVTKLVQKGVERGRAVALGGWLGGDEDPPLALEPTLGETNDTPAKKLLDYLKALERKGVGEYDLDLTVLVKGASGVGKKTLVRGVVKSVGLGLLEIDAYDLLSDSPVKTEAHLKARVEKAISCSPSVLFVKNLDALARKKDQLESGQEPAMTSILRSLFASCRQSFGQTGHPVVVIATTTDVDKVPTGILGAFKTEIQIDAPNEQTRQQILNHLTKSDILAPDVSLKNLAIQTAALLANDLVSLVRRARGESIGRVLKELSTSSPSTSTTSLLTSIHHSGHSLTAADLNAALEKSRLAYSESIGAPKIPNVTWDDVGGLGAVKGDILDTIQLPLERPDLFSDGLKKRSGILLYGPPGTGKTLLAKAVATTCSLNFFSIKGPELLNMYIGESEANVRRVFQRARDAKPCVIFFDELDSVAPKRGNQGDSGGVMDRIVSQLLAELDGMSGGKGGEGVFVIGATNRPDLLDPALLRPGRFDRMLYLGVSQDHVAQLKILQALTRKFKLAPDVRLEDIAEMCPFNYTGADFYALCSDAMLGAMSRKAESVDAKIAELNKSSKTTITPQYYLAELASPSDLEVLVAHSDFVKSLSELVPSVSQAEMRHYESVQKEFSGPQTKAAKEEKALPPPIPIASNGHQRNGSASFSLNGSANGSNGVNGYHVESLTNGDSHHDESTDHETDGGKGKGKGKAKWKGKGKEKLKEVVNGFRDN